MRPITAIAGRPNTGKTTLFNALTGRRQRVANFAGCTVEKAVGVLEREETALEIVDLPGTFSLTPETQDERVALGFLAEKALAGADLRVLVVAEASNLGSDLPLALGLSALGYAVALVVNMIDEAAKNGLTIDRAALELETGLPVFLTCARERRGLSELDAFLLGPRPAPAAPWRDWRYLPPRELDSLQDASRKSARRIAAAALPQPAAGLLKTTSRSIARCSIPTL
jgi:ferrous iron transport protein B